MSFKTTAILTVVLLILLGWFFTARPELQTTTIATPTTSPTGTTIAQQHVFDDPPEIDDVVAVSASRPGQRTWKFQRVESEDDDPQKAWQIVEPIRSDVPKWEIDNLVRTVKDLKYQIKYAPGQPDAVTLEQAGLETPRLLVTLEARDGRTLDLQVGKPAGNNQTFVRVAGAGDILVAQKSLDRLLKKSVNEYRDKAVFKFAAADAVALNILHRPAAPGSAGGSTVTYRLVKRDDSHWVFEQPFNADANHQTVIAAITAASRLRVIDWVDFRSDAGISRFGLAPPTTEVEIVTQTVTVPPPSSDAPDGADIESPDGEAGAQPPGQGDAPPQPPAPPGDPSVSIETHRYAFHLSDRSPLGQDSWNYFKLADDDAVATISKSVAAKFIPTVEKWRNMDICTAPVTGATQVRIRTSGASLVTLEKNDRNDWVFQDSEVPPAAGPPVLAEAGEIDELLKTIDKLEALNFVDHADPQDPIYGLAEPRVEITLTIPGQDQPETISLGNPTDDVAKRVYYLRRGQSSSIAKIRASAAAILDRKPEVYLDRKIIGISMADLQTVRLTRPSAVSVDTASLTLTRDTTGWIGCPIPSQGEGLTGDQQLACLPADPAAAIKLVATIVNLRAQQVVARAGTDRDYGLDQPTLRVTVTYNAPIVIKIDDDGHVEDAPPHTHTQPSALPGDPLLSIELIITELGSDLYARRTDLRTVFRLRRADYDVLTADFLDKKIMNFEQSQAVSVAVTAGDNVHRFDKKDQGWIYAPAPDLPINPKKVTNLLLQIQDLRLKRYVAYGATDLAPYGLDKPHQAVKVVVEGGKTIVLLVSDRPCPADSDNSLYAVIQGTRNIFLMTPDSVSRFDISLDEFEQPADS